MKNKNNITPINAIANSWDSVDACKHWFPCDRLTNGRLVDVKGNVIINPQDGYAFEYDAALGAVRSTADVNAAREELHSGSWEPIPANQSCLVFSCGYVENVTYTPTNERFIRLAIGDTATTVGTGGIGMSDGEGGSSLAAHVIARLDASHIIASRSIVSAVSAGDAIHNAIGATGHFFRYALYRHDGLTMESRIYRTDTGALLQENEQQYGNAVSAPAFPFATQFRMSGVKQTSFGVFHFATVPSDYLLAMHTMAAAARYGNKIVWPHWA